MFRSPVIFVICSTVALASQKTELPVANERVVEFSRKSVGKEIGDGQCTGLAQEALGEADAKSYRDFAAGRRDDNANLVWGEPAYSLDVNDGKLQQEQLLNPPVLPGDIVQLRDVLFEGRLNGRPYRMFTDQHTAVVNTVSKDGSRWGVIQQNYNGKKTVTKGTYNLRDLKKGSVRVFRPVPMKSE